MDNLPAFKIAKRDNITDYDCCVRQYRNCIINTLINLHSKYIFEIGSFLFQTSSAISYYIDKYIPEGKLITADISLWNRGEPPARVYPVMFWPYDENIEDEHGGIKVFHSNYKEVAQKKLALELNTLKLFEIMSEHNIRNFDFVFVDGSHSKISFQSDLKLAKLVTKKNGYILIDDIYERHYDQFHVYNKLKENNKFYEYSDWNPQPGFALIKNKDLQLYWD